MIIYPYKIGSRSAKNIRTALNATHDRKVCWVLQRPPRASRSLIVNWGANSMEFNPRPGHHVINPPDEVSVMTDKVKFFARTNHDKHFLEWTTDRSAASEWGVKDKIFVRHLTRGSGGRGIDVWQAASGTVIPAAPLYTRHQKKTHEYRIHLGKALKGVDYDVLLVQRKVFRPELQGAPKSWDVRSHDNGFIFQAYSEDKIPSLPKEIFKVAKKAMGQYFPKLHFAALDVLYHQPSDTAVICEGNTAPGLENNSVDIYCRYLTQLEKDFRVSH